MVDQVIIYNVLNLDVFSYLDVDHVMISICTFLANML